LRFRAIHAHHPLAKTAGRCCVAPTEQASHRAVKPRRVPGFPPPPPAAAFVRLHVGRQSRRGAALAQRRVGSLAINRAAFENASNEKGEPLIWLPPDALAKLKALRGPGETFSDVILALAASG
jgi:hypothetical protein